MKRILVGLILLCAWFEAAHAQDRTKPAIFAQLGHSGSANAVAFSPNGTVLASGSDDHTIKLWEVASGRELRTLSGHTDSVESVAFSPDGTLLASGSLDNTITLWDAASGRELRTLREPHPLEGHAHAVTAIAFSPDGKWLASGGWDYTVKLWEVASGRELGVLSGHTDTVRSVAFSPDGRLLASGSDDRTVKLWDAASGRELRGLSGHAGGVYSVAFSPDGKVLASGDGELHGSAVNATVKLWDVAAGRELRTMDGHADRVLSLAFSPDGNVLASGDGGHLEPSLMPTGVIQLWDVASGRELRTLSGHASWARAVAFSPDGKMLASGGADKTVKLWDPASGRELRTLTGPTRWVSMVAFSPDGKWIASGSADKTVRLWDAASGRQLRTLTGHADSIHSMAFSPDGKVLASGSLDKTIKLWDLASGRELRTLMGRGWIDSVAFSPDGKLLASSSDDIVNKDTTVTVWEVASGRVLRSLSGHTDPVESVAFSPDGKVLASGGDDTDIRLWDVASGRGLRTLTGHANIVLSVAISPDGKQLASSSADNTIRLWDMASGRELRILSAHAYWINALAFSPDGKVLVAGSRDHTIRRWDVASRRELAPLTGHLGDVSSVAFSPDGKMLVSGGEDGTTREWDETAGKERVALIAFNDGSSIAVTPEGFFDSSSARAEDNLNVRIGDRVFGISSFRESFYRPDLVRAGLAGEPLAQYGSIETVKLSPVIQLASLPPSTTGSELKVSLRLTDGGGGVGTVRLFSGGTVILQDSQPHPADALTRTYAVPLFNGSNDLQVTAANADGSMWSGAQASVGAVGAIDAKPAARGGTLYAVVIGIQDFPNSLASNRLSYSIADARLTVDTLKKYATPLFDKVDIRLLTSLVDTDRDHILRVLKAMQSEVGPTDEFIFYVASHGVIYDGEYYLITSNVSSDPDRLRADAISRPELTDLLANIRTRKKIAIIDTCEAGALRDAFAVTRGMSARTAVTILSRSIGLTELAATTTNQEALEGYKGHGLFTYVLMDGLTGKAADAVTGIVRSDQIARYVDAEVPPLARGMHNRDQQPTANQSGEPFAITAANAAPVAHPDR